MPKFGLSYYPPQSSNTSAMSTALSTPRVQTPDSDGVMIESYTFPPLPLAGLNPGNQGPKATGLRYPPAAASVISSDRTSPGTVGPPMSPMPASAAFAVEKPRDVSPSTGPPARVDELATEPSSPLIAPESGTATPLTQNVAFLRQAYPTMAAGAISPQALDDSTSKVEVKPPASVGRRSPSRTPSLISEARHGGDTTTAARVEYRSSPVANSWDLSWYPIPGRPNLPPSSMSIGLPSGGRQAHTLVPNTRSVSWRDNEPGRMPNYTVVRPEAFSRTSTPPVIVPKSPQTVVIEPVTRSSSSHSSRPGIPTIVKSPAPPQDMADSYQSLWDTIPVQRQSSRRTNGILADSQTIQPPAFPAYQQPINSNYPQPPPSVHHPFYPLVPPDMTRCPQPPHRKYNPISFQKNSIRFYLKDGSYTFQARDIVYNVHKHVLDSSSFFTSEIENWGWPLNPYDLNPFCEPREFELLLSIFYPSDFTVWDVQGVKDWTSVLRLAHDFGMKKIRTLAIKQLYPITTAAQKIELANNYDIKDWLMPAYMELCTRMDYLTVEEGKKMGIEAVIAITKMRTEFVENVKNLVERSDELRRPKAELKV